LTPTERLSGWAESGSDTAPLLLVDQGGCLGLWSQDTIEDGSVIRGCSAT
jgi:hypothetical protein